MMITSDDDSNGCGVEGRIAAATIEEDCIATKLFMYVYVRLESGSHV